ncbi:hypothetical protein ACIRPH_12640 [Nocardiopsis sp. NPDC101807]|uniref:hypothetical protein n=1 Tax=Nocardiopsis sp. NPDC101807 TaxID=3364339 RepID=UPI003812DDF2
MVGQMPTGVAAVAVIATLPVVVFFFVLWVIRRDTIRKQGAVRSPDYWKERPDGRRYPTGGGEDRDGEPPEAGGGAGPPPGSGPPGRGPGEGGEPGRAPGEGGEPPQGAGGTEGSGRGGGPEGPEGPGREGGPPER